jgi:hypothetical protein
MNTYVLVIFTTNFGSQHNFHSRWRFREEAIDKSAASSNVAFGGKAMLLSAFFAWLSWHASLSFLRKMILIACTGIQRFDGWRPFRSTGIQQHSTVWWAVQATKSALEHRFKIVAATSLVTRF